MNKEINDFIDEFIYDAINCGESENAYQYEYRKAQIQESKEKLIAMIEELGKYDKSEIERLKKVNRILTMGLEDIAIDTGIAANKWAIDRADKAIYEAKLYWNGY